MLEEREVTKGVSVGTKRKIMLGNSLTTRIIIREKNDCVKQVLKKLGFSRTGLERESYKGPVIEFLHL